MAPNALEEEGEAPDSVEAVLMRRLLQPVVPVDGVLNQSFSAAGTRRLLYIPQADDNPVISPTAVLCNGHTVIRQVP